MIVRLVERGVRVSVGEVIRLWRARCVFLLTVKVMIASLARRVCHRHLVPRHSHTLFHEIGLASSRFVNNEVAGSDWPKEQYFVFLASVD